jgi:hypothetical protein
MAVIDRLYLQPESPKLFDRPIQDIQRSIAKKLLFMHHVFGRCERLAKVVDGRTVYSPNVYKGGDEYILLTPDNADLGNYCFFIREEPETMVENFGNHGRMRATFSLVVWVDMRTIEDKDQRNVYDFELKVLDAVASPGVLRSGGVTVNRVYHRAESVFDGFSLVEVDNQFLMSPFYGLRIKFELWVDEDCNV